MPWEGYLIEPRDLLRILTATAVDRKAEDIVILDVTGKTSVAEFFFLASSVSQRQTKSLANALLDEAKKHKAVILGNEGMNSGKWILLDFGDIVCHLFQAPVREFYDLEGLWVDAPRIEADTLIAEPAS